MSKLEQWMDIRHGEAHVIINCLNIKEVIRMLDVSLFPSSKSVLFGVACYHGKIISIIDLFALSVRKRTGDQQFFKILIIERMEVSIGILLSFIDGVVSLPVEFKEKIDIKDVCFNSFFVKCIHGYLINNQKYCIVDVNGLFDCLNYN